MFIQCHLPNRNDELFLLYDSSDFNVEELGFQLEDVEVVEPEKIMSEYKNYPILNLNDFLLRLLRPKERTKTHLLGELGLDSLYQLETEKQKIDAKKSILSRTQRECVLERYNDIITLCLTKNE
jgi:hypothetical protein